MDLTSIKLCSNPSLCSSVYLWVSQVCKTISPISKVSLQTLNIFAEVATGSRAPSWQLSIQWVQWFISDWQLWPNFSPHQQWSLWVSGQAKSMTHFESESVFSTEKTLKLLAFPLFQATNVTLSESPSPEEFHLPELPNCLDYRHEPTTPSNVVCLFVCFHILKMEHFNRSVCHACTGSMLTFVSPHS